MFCAAMSNSTSLSEDAATSVSSAGTKVVHDFASLNPHPVSSFPHQQSKIKKKRSLPGNPDPEAEVIALSPKTLMATNRFVCEVCNKGFQRDQNLQLHRRGHNLPWKLKQRSSKEVKKKAYVCPEESCVHHHPSRALGDLTGIKKHFCRKHGEKKWKCDKCSKVYAVQSDWKAHSKTCGTREYKCDCGTLFSRKDSFLTHRAFCDALAEESARLSATQFVSTTPNPNPDGLSDYSHLLHHRPQNQSSLLFPNFTTQVPPHHDHQNHHHQHISLTSWDPPPQNPNPNHLVHIKPEPHHLHNNNINIIPTFFREPSPSRNNNNIGNNNNLMTLSYQNLHVSTQPASTGATSAHHLSATALLQKAATVGATTGIIAAGSAQHHQQPQSAGHVTHDQSSLTHTNMSHHHHHHVGNFGPPASHHHISPEFQGLSTWQKSDRLTRDFLGLNGDHHRHNIYQNNNIHEQQGSGVHVSVNTRDMLNCTRGVEFDTYERDQSILLNLNPHGNGFGFAESSASEAWGDC